MTCSQRQTPHPVRGATVELLSDTNSVLQTTTTDVVLGNHSFDLVQGAMVRVHVRAELLNTGGSATYDVKGVDNTNSGEIYTLTEAAASNASLNSTRDLNAGSGWGGPLTRVQEPQARLQFSTQFICQPPDSSKLTQT